jgi:hypothetical protein
MHTTRSHTNIEEVLAAAGIQMATIWERPQMSAANDWNSATDRVRSSARLSGERCDCEGNIAEIGDGAAEKDAIVHARHVCNYAS